MERPRQRVAGGGIGTTIVMLPAWLLFDTVLTTYQQRGNMDIGILFVLFAFTVLPLSVFHIWALVDVLKTPTTAWAEAEQNQIVWAIVVLALFVVGPILYLIIARPRLVAARGGSTS